MERIIVKTFRSVALALAIGAVSITSANAHDSFSFGINIGGAGFAPPAVFYAPPVYYASPIYHAPAPVVYYHPAHQYYGVGQRFAPAVSYHYYNDGFRGHRGNGWGNRSRGHRDGHHHRGRRGWDD